jgi:hypothetical protein
MDCHDYLYPYMQLILDIDQSSGHTKGRDDALRVTGGNISWGGTQTSMRSSVVCQECLDNEPGKCLFPGNNQFMDFTKADEDEWYLQKEEGSRLTAGPCWYDSTATPHDREENQMTAEEIKKKKEQIKTKQGIFKAREPSWKSQRIEINLPCTSQLQWMSGSLLLGGPRSLRGLSRYCMKEASGKQA